MKYLTVDFGSTYTKLTAIDTERGDVIGTAAAFTTIETDVMEGFNNGMQQLEAQIGHFEYDRLLCCSSAAGGLKMVALGLVPELTAKAAKMAASSAGAKVVKTYSFEISHTEQQEIYDINPDLVLLCGGTDGGNKDVIIANAKRLCAIDRDFSIIAAGNKTASDELEEIFKASNKKKCVIAENVMPQFNVININPAKQKIKELFISRIIEAKGLSRIQEMSGYDIIPTPLAVLTGCELFSKGYGHDGCRPRWRNHRHIFYGKRRAHGSRGYHQGTARTVQQTHRRRRPRNALQPYGDGGRDKHGGVRRRTRD